MMILFIESLELKTAVGLILPTDRSLIALEQGKAIIPPNYTRCIQVRKLSRRNLVNNFQNISSMDFPMKVYESCLSIPIR